MKQHCKELQPFRSKTGLGAECERAGCNSRAGSPPPALHPHACLLAAQKVAARSKLSPGEMPFWMYNSFPPLPMTT